MATSMLCYARSRSLAVACPSMTRRLCHSSPPSLFNKLLLKLNSNFYDIEHILRWSSWFKTRAVRRNNVFYGYTQKRFGVNVAAAYYILRLGGGFRFTGQSEWFHASSRGKFSYSFINTPDSTIEEIDLSRTLINHNGLDNIVSQKGLRSLRVQGCPEVDDWFLARLHVFGETLEELDVSRCPRITVGGLAALQHLRKLQKLDVSSLVAVTSPGLVRILLEEMLPLCKVTGAEYEQGLIQPGSMEPAEEVTVNTTELLADPDTARQAQTR